jgi:uncharacterized DUF497 family protein
MMFEWDEQKNEANRQRHGISFEDVLPVFELAEGQSVMLEDTRKDYGEARLILLCPFRGSVLHVTFTWRGDRIRLISARRANKREIQGYDRLKHH